MLDSVLHKPVAHGDIIKRIVTSAPNTMYLVRADTCSKVDLFFYLKYLDYPPKLMVSYICWTLDCFEDLVNLMALLAFLYKIYMYSSNLNFMISGVHRLETHLQIPEVKIFHQSTQQTPRLKTPSCWVRVWTRALEVRSSPQL